MELSEVESYMLQAWARICTAIKDDFCAYLPMVMPYILKAAARGIAPVNDGDFAEDDPELDFVEGEDGKIIRVHTSALEDKATAVSMLGCFVQDLKESFAP